MKLQIVDSDYNNYLILWACENDVDQFASKSILFLISALLIRDLITAYLWVYSRKRVLSEEVIGKLNVAFKTYNLDSSLLINADQNNC